MNQTKENKEDNEENLSNMKEIKDVVIFSYSLEMFKRKNLISWILSNMRKPINLSEDFPKQQHLCEQVLFMTTSNDIVTKKDFEVVNDDSVMGIPTQDLKKSEKQLLLSNHSQIRVVYQEYNMILALDVSPSMKVFDPMTGEVLVDRVLPILEKILQFLLTPIKITNNVLNPKISISIICVGGVFRPVHTIFQDIQLTKDNVFGLFEKISKKFHGIIEKESQHLRKILAIKAKKELLKKNNNYKTTEEELNKDKNWENCTFATIIENTIGGFSFFRTPNLGKKTIILITDSIFTMSRLKFKTNLQLAEQDINLVIINISNEKNRGLDQIYCRTFNPDVLLFVAKGSGTVFQYKTISRIIIDESKWPEEKEEKKFQINAKFLLQQSLFFHYSILSHGEETITELIYFNNIYDDYDIKTTYNELYILKKYNINRNVLEKIIDARIMEGFFICCLDYNKHFKNGIKNKKNQIISESEEQINNRPLYLNFEGEVFIHSPEKTSVNKEIYCCRKKGCFAKIEFDSKTREKRALYPPKKENFHSCKGQVIKRILLRFHYWPAIELEYEILFQNRNLAQVTHQIRSSTTFNTIFKNMNSFLKDPKFRKQKGDVLSICLLMDATFRKMVKEDMRIALFRKVCDDQKFLSTKGKELFIGIKQNEKFLSSFPFFNESVLSFVFTLIKQDDDSYMFGESSSFFGRNNYVEVLRKSYDLVARCLITNFKFISIPKIQRSILVKFVQGKLENKGGFIYATIEFESAKMLNISLRFFNISHHGQIQQITSSVKKILTDNTIGFKCQEIDNFVFNTFKSIPKANSDIKQYTESRFSSLPYYNSFLEHRKWVWSLKEYESIHFIMNVMKKQRIIEKWKVICQHPATIFLKTISLTTEDGISRQFFMFYTLHYLQAIKKIITEIWVQPLLGNVLGLDECDVYKYIEDTIFQVDKRIVSSFVTFESMLLVSKAVVDRKSPIALHFPNPKKGSREMKNLGYIDHNDNISFREVLFNYKIIWERSIKRDVKLEINTKETYDRLISYLMYLNDVRLQYWENEESKENVFEVKGVKFFCMTLDKPDKVLLTLLHPYDQKTGKALVRFGECSLTDLNHSSLDHYSRESKIVLDIKSESELDDEFVFNEEDESKLDDDFEQEFNDIDTSKKQNIEDSLWRDSLTDLTKRFSPLSEKIIAFIIELHYHSYSYEVFKLLRENEESVTKKQLKRAIEICCEYSEEIKLNELFLYSKDSYAFPYCVMKDIGVPNGDYLKAFLKLLGMGGFHQTKQSKYHFYYFNEKLETTNNGSLKRIGSYEKGVSSISENLKTINSSTRSLEEIEGLDVDSFSKHIKREESRNKLNKLLSDGDLSGQYSFGSVMSFMENNNQVEDLKDNNGNLGEGIDNPTQLFLRFELEISNKNTQRKIKIPILAFSKSEILKYIKDKKNEKATLRVVLICKSPHLNSDIYNFSDCDRMVMKNLLEKWKPEYSKINKSKFDMKFPKMSDNIPKKRIKKSVANLGTSLEENLTPDHLLHEDNGEFSLSPYEKGYLSFKKLNGTTIYNLGLRLKQHLRGIVSRDLLFCLLKIGMDRPEKPKNQPNSNELMSVVFKHIGRVSKNLISQREVSIKLYNTSKSISLFSEEMKKSVNYLYLPIQNSINSQRSSGNLDKEVTTSFVVLLKKKEILKDGNSGYYLFQEQIKDPNEIEEFYKIGEFVQPYWILGWYSENKKKIVLTFFSPFYVSTSQRMKLLKLLELDLKTMEGIVNQKQLLDMTLEKSFKKNSYWINTFKGFNEHRDGMKGFEKFLQKCQAMDLSLFDKSLKSYEDSHTTIPWIRIMNNLENKFEESALILKSNNYIDVSGIEKGKLFKNEKMYLVIQNNKDQKTSLLFVLHYIIGECLKFYIYTKDQIITKEKLNEETCSFINKIINEITFETWKCFSQYS